MNKKWLKKPYWQYLCKNSSDSALDILIEEKDSLANSIYNMFSDLILNENDRAFALLQELTDIAHTSPPLFKYVTSL